MKKFRFQSLLALLLLVGAVASYSQIRRSPSPRTLSARQIVDKVMPSVVLIVAQDNQGETIAQGSGFVYKPGLIATNLHLLKRASKAFVRVVGKEVNYKVTKVVGIDARHDLCILRVDEKTLPPVVINTTGKATIGDEIFTFGNPKGLEGTVSKGIISSIRSELELLQIDAAISPGSSGGPIVNVRAEVIGISVSSLVGGQNLNFAIPSPFLTRISDQQFVDAELKGVDDLIGYPSDFGVSIAGAGTVAVSDREAAFLLGAVKNVTSYHATFDYDEKPDKFTEELRKPSDKQMFDQFGNLVEEWNYDFGDLAWKYFYSYDKNGLRTRVIWEPSAGIDRKREALQFSPVEAVRRRLDDNLVNLSGTFEDSAGKRVYDDLGNRTESLIKLNGMRWLNSFDRNGFVLEQKLYEADKLSKAYRYTYEFDSRGNWIRQIKSEFNSKYPSLGFLPLSVVYREITYF